MTALFGYSLDSVARGLLLACGVLLLLVLLLALARPMLARIALRQAPRRRAQMVLVVLGLSLGASIVTSVFLTGDTVETAIHGQVVEGLGNIDEILHDDRGPYVRGDVDLTNLSGLDTRAPAAQTRALFLDELSGRLVTEGDPASEVYFPLDVYRSLRAALARSTSVAALLPEAVEHHALLTDATSRQIRGEVKVIGLPPRPPAPFGALRDTRGRAVEVAHLPPGATAINAVAAADLGARPGDQLLLFLRRRRYRFRLDVVVGNGGLAGATPSLLLPLPTLQTLMDQPGAIDRILVVNRGADDAAAAANSAAAAYDLSSAAPPNLAIDEAKREGLHRAEQAEEIFSRIFTLFGLFAIGVGLLLVFLIFTILAADRRPELGISRVVGLKRRDLTLMYLLEGTIYAVVAAGLGLALGIAIGAGIVDLLNLVLDNYGFTLAFVIHLHAVVISYALGLLATWLTVVPASWWATRLTVSSAIRDLPEPGGLPAGPLRLLLRPWARLFRRMRGTFTTENTQSTQLGPGHRGSTERKMSLAPLWPHPREEAACLPPDRSRPWSAMRPQSQAPPLRLLSFLVDVVFGALAAAIALCARGPGYMAAGAFAVHIGLDAGETAPFAGGISLLILGAALALRTLLHLIGVSARAGDRLAFTLGGAGLVAYWSLPADTPQRLGLPPMQTGIEIFFLAGLAMVLGAVWIALYNLDASLRPLARLLLLPGRLTAAVRTAAAYTLHRPARTGLILAMFALVSFTLTVMAVVTDALERTYGDVQAQTGGFDIRGDLLYDDSIPSLATALRHSPYVDPHAFSFAGSQGYVPVGVVQLSAPNPGWRLAYADVVDGDFLRGATFHLLSRARGYESDAAVWAALRHRHDVALIGSDLLPGGGGDAVLASGDGVPLPYTLAAAATPGFAPVSVWMADPRGGGAVKLRIIGVVDDGDGRHGGLIVPAATMARAGIPPVPATLFFRVASGQDVTAQARRLGSAFLDHGLQTTVLASAVWVERGPKILLARLLEGFVGLVLVLGIAGLAAAAMRSVVERRQQIGMLRALGMSRRTIRLAFLLESSAVALAGLGIGMALGLLLARNLFLADFFEQYQTGLTMQAPWHELALAAAATYGMALLATLLPARLAGRVTPAEALLDR